MMIFIISVSCGGKEINKASSSDNKKDTTILDKKSTANNQEITESGLLKQVEDSGYPFATLTIEFPDRDLTEYFTINMEAVANASMTEINKYTGQHVKFTYTADISNAILDMYYESKSIFGAEVAPEGDGIKTIEGTLSGAGQTTDGDIPGEVSILADNGENLYFQYFITPEMVSVNEKKVTAFYDSRTINTIKSIQLVK